MIISLKRWGQMAAALWDEVMRDADHIDALQDNESWDEVQARPSLHDKGIPTPSKCDVTQGGETRWPAQVLDHID